MRNIFRIENDEMDVGIIKGIVSLCARSYSSSFCISRQIKYVIIDTCFILAICTDNIMITNCGPEHGIDQALLIHILKPG